VQYVQSIDADTLVKTYRSGPSFYDRVSGRVTNLRAIVGRTVELTGALERRMVDYYRLRGKSSVSMPVPPLPENHPPLSSNVTHDPRQRIGGR
jgi:hypothetical protein